jgi:hypothetical protein
MSENRSGMRLKLHLFRRNNKYLKTKGEFLIKYV